MNLNQTFDLSMAATAYTPWVDTRGQTGVLIGTSCGDVNDPTGAITVEVSMDFPTIEQELYAGVASASSTATKFDATSTLTVRGDAFSNGYNGSGAKVSSTGLNRTTYGFTHVRVKYTRTSGGAGDVLKVRIGSVE